MEKKTEIAKKGYVAPAMVKQGDFTKVTAGYFVGPYKEWIVRRIV
ncbi:MULTISPECIES: keywimysin-related RiPP [Streptomyces]|uniref:Lasso RiPP family leader peptide-containing protein n=1 Tax=Streptomyces xanthii TaxID=2768069 RepID=A0A7H1B5D2_9ACTN|nr:keywimysin-related RiPP [Streptomyces xanthii]QNS03937.1 lasso RiPP family leader peptide-containing protein [Streptomyces xanthii]